MSWLGAQPLFLKRLRICGGDPDRWGHLPLLLCVRGGLRSLSVFVTILALAFATNAAVAEQLALGVIVAGAMTVAAEQATSEAAAPLRAWPKIARGEVARLSTTFAS